jgi:hypothetical protein
MRVLVYKRTHEGDPDLQGRFGVYDCMGSMRDWEYDAVIGVGGSGKEAQDWDIDGKLNWIGIEPHKTTRAGLRGPLVIFEHFRYFGAKGTDFAKLAPSLAKRMKHARLVIAPVNAKERAEIGKILALAAKAPSSLAVGGAGRQGRGCVTSRC